MNRCFFDSNVLVYAFQNVPHKSAVARSWLADGGAISVQTLNECANVLRRKLGRPWQDVFEALAIIQARCSPPSPLTLESHERGLEIASANTMQIYDALIVTAALDAGCEFLLSEDLQHGRVFEGRLTVRNPFLGS